jgi:hypothetical protein
VLAGALVDLQSARAPEHRMATSFSRNNGTRVDLRALGAASIVAAYSTPFDFRPVECDEFIQHRCGPRHGRQASSREEGLKRMLNRDGNLSHIGQSNSR